MAPDCGLPDVPNAVREPPDPGRVRPEQVTHFRALGFRAFSTSKELELCRRLGLRLHLLSTSDLGPKALEEVYERFDVVAHPFIR